MAAKDYSLDITLNGRLTPATLKAFADTENMLKRMGASVKTQNAAMNAMYKQAFSGAVEAARQTDKLSDSMRRIGEISAGVTIGDVLATGMQKSVDLIKQAVGLMGDLAKRSADAAAKFELMRMGMGAILRDQPFAKSLLDTLQIVAYKSPFQLAELGGTARALAGRGMAKGDLLRSTKELGDITAAVGGGADILDRLTLAYGEAFSQKTIDKRITRQFTAAGVPIYDALLQAMGLKPDQMNKLVKMIHDKKVSFEDLDKAIYQLTHGAGLFTGGMLNFAQTTQGVITTFQDMWQRAERDLGDIINDWRVDFFRFINDSKIWDSLHEWMTRIRGWSDGVRRYVESIGGPEIERRLEVMGSMFTGFLKKITGGFDPETMFGQVMVHAPDPKHPGQFLKNATEGTYLTDAGKAWVNAMLGPIERFLDALKEMGARLDTMGERLKPLNDALGKGIELLNKWDDLLYGRIYPALGALFKWIDDTIFGWLGKLHIGVPDTLKGGIGPWWEEWQKELHNNTDAQEKATDATEELRKAMEGNSGASWGIFGSPPGGVSPKSFGRSIGGNAAMHAVLGSGDVRVEGYGPSYGEMGQIIGNHQNALFPGDYAVSPNLLQGHKPGDTFSFIDAKGVVRRGRYEDTSMKAPGVPNTNIIEGWNQEDRGSIKGIQWDKPTSNIHIHINAIDSDSFASTVHKHAEIIASHVSRVMSESFERSAVV